MKIENVKEIKDLGSVYIQGSMCKHRKVIGSNGVFELVVLPGQPSIIFGQDYTLEGEEGGSWMQM